MTQAPAERRHRDAVASAYPHIERTTSTFIALAKMLANFEATLRPEQPRPTEMGDEFAGTTFETRAERTGREASEGLCPHGQPGTVNCPAVSRPTEAGDAGLARELANDLTPGTLIHKLIRYAEIQEAGQTRIQERPATNSWSVAFREAAAALSRAPTREAVVEGLTKHMLDMAKSYELGSPESRAIVTAVEHARALTAKEG